MQLNNSLNQTATYWAPPNDRSQTDKFGKPVLAAPVQVKCRWEDRIAVIVSKTGEDYTSKTRVFFSQDVDVDGYLYLGTTAEANPANLLDAHEIQGKTTTPNLRTAQALTTVFL